MRHNATNSLDNPFWQYSIAIYQNTELKNVLLEGQALGLDVNLLLFCGYLSKEGYSLNSVIDKLSPINHWQVHTVQAIRKLRKRVKPINQEWYREMKSLELKAEQIEQACLYQISLRAEKCTQQNLLAANLNAYLAHKDIQAQKKWLQALLKHLQLS